MSTDSRGRSRTKRLMAVSPFIAKTSYSATLTSLKVARASAPHAAAESSSFTRSIRLLDRKGFVMIHAARHDDVGQHEIDHLALFQEGQSLCRAMRARHGEPMVLEHVGSHFGDFDVVIDDENAPRGVAHALLRRRLR